MSISCAPSTTCGFVVRPISTGAALVALLLNPVAAVGTDDGTARLQLESLHREGRQALPYPGPAATTPQHPSAAATDLQSLQAEQTDALSMQQRHDRISGRSGAERGWRDIARQRQFTIEQRSLIDHYRGLPPPAAWQRPPLTGLPGRPAPLVLPR